MLPSPPPTVGPAPPPPAPPPVTRRRRRSLVPRMFPLAAVMVVGASPTVAQAVEQGSIEVAVEGKGRVTGTQIDCPEGSCRGRYSWPNGTMAPLQRLVAVPAAGWRLASWSGCFAVPGRPLECDAQPNEHGSAVTASFADATPPTLTMTVPVEGTPITPQASLDPMLQAADNDALDRVEYRINGVLRATATSAPWSTEVPIGGPWPDGPITLTAESVDRTGNRSAPVSRTLVVDGTAPQVTFDGPESVRTRAGSHTLTFSVTDAHLAGVTCTVTRPDGAVTNPVACTGAPWMISLFDVGTWTFTVTAADRVGLRTVARVTILREANPGPDPDPGPDPGPGPGPDPGPGPSPDPSPGPDPHPGGGPGPSPGPGFLPAPGPLPGPAPLPDPPGGSATDGVGKPKSPGSAERCVVPKVARGTALKTAKKRLTRANCRVRTVRVKTRTVRTGRVIRISSKAGKKLPKGARITVTVARR